MKTVVRLYEFTDLLGSLLYPIALRVAKTPLSFGHSECNRVKASNRKILVVKLETG